MNFLFGLLLGEKIIKAKMTVGGKKGAFFGTLPVAGGEMLFPNFPSFFFPSPPVIRKEGKFWEIVFHP